MKAQKLLWLPWVPALLPALVGCSDPLDGVTRTYAVSCQLRGAPDEPPKIKLTEVLTGTQTVNPVSFVAANDGSPRVFVVGQGGLIQVAEKVTADGTLRTWLDLSAKITFGGEMGLLSMAFAPDYAKSGRFYVNYTARTPQGQLQTRVTRFRVPAPPLGDPDPKSEQVILTINQPYENHNGGQVAFGPDGSLYIGMGDGGAGGDPENSGQRRDTLLGKMLRIDVSTTDASYRIPADNPFYKGQSPAVGTAANNSHCKDQAGKAGTCGEIWALGLRNPWRFSFDPVGGTLWAGDVGQGTKEEVDIIEKGKNYGWRCMEGLEEYVSDMSCEALRAAGAFTPPVHDYPRSDGKSISGGVVYRGRALPGLYGAYLFGDYVDRNLWALQPGDGGSWRRTTLATQVGNISGFGVDQSGEVYVLDYSGGKLLRIEAAAPGATGAPGWPARLSETGCFRDLPALQLVEGALRYDVNVPLWSDAADKQRAVVLPGGATLGFTEEGTWQVPQGTIFIKTFLSEGKKMETRFLIREGDGVRGASYRWNPEGTDGDLLTAGVTAQVAGREWTFPSRADCQACHTKAAGAILGMTTAQLNRDHDVFGTGAVSQIDALSRIGYLTGVPRPAAELQKAPPPGDEEAELGARARAYLDSNCSSCHRPGGLANATMDLRAGTPLQQTMAIGVKAQHGDLGVPGALVVAPGQPAQSTLYLRMMSLDRAQRMPNLASAVVDPQGTALVRAWIAGLGGM